MTRWSSEFRLLAAAIVVLSCSSDDAHAFALCENCPDLFATTSTTSTAQRTARAEPRAPSTRVHDRYVSRRWHGRGDDPLRPSQTRRTALTAFAAVPIGSGATGANVAAAITDSTPPVADAATPATPAFRIDVLFNMLAAGPSDQPEEVAGLRARVLNQLLIRQSASSPGEGVGVLIPTLIVLGGGLLIGAVLISARRQVPARPRMSGRQPSRTMLLSDRPRRLKRRLSGNSPEGPTVSPEVRGRVAGLLNQTGATSAGGWPRWGNERSRA
jgi:hypothetical protein